MNEGQTVDGSQIVNIAVTYEELSLLKSSLVSHMDRLDRMAHDTDRPSIQRSARKKTDVADDLYQKLDRISE